MSLEKVQGMMPGLTPATGISLSTEKIRVVKALFEHLLKFRTQTSSIQGSVML